MNEIIVDQNRTGQHDAGEAARASRRVVCMLRKWRHHTPSGGYDLLAPAVGATEIWRSMPAGLASRVARRIWKICDHGRIYPRYYDFEDWLTELRVLTTCAFNVPDVVHVLYGEQHLDLLLTMRRVLRCPLVASFHLPAEDHELNVVPPAKVAGIDLAVVVARSQIPGFQRLLGPDKVVYVPHGIDTAKFRPGHDNSQHGELRVLVVGLWLRDWEVLHRVIDEVDKAGLNIKFDIVTLPEFFPYLTGCSNVTLHSGISESRLIQLYRESDLLFVPLKDATANNAVLEALACGTPVMATDVGGIPDYVTNECGWLVPKGDPAPPLALLKQIYADRELVRSRREAARVQALKFEWGRVAERLSTLYAALCDGRSPAAAVEALEASKG
jgi:glycosyltransferase involved in cell wall biosynthesis